MRRISLEDEESVLKRVIEGATYRDISRELDFSLATVNRVVEDAREKIQDMDTLRRLSVLLRKYKVSVFDAMRGCSLAETLNGYGINLQDLGNYIKLTEKILEEQALEKGFVYYATKLMELEQNSGKTYQEITEEFERKYVETTELENKKMDTSGEICRLEIDAEEAGKNLSSIYLEIEKATSVHEGLAKIGINVLDKLVKLVPEFESLGFDANELGELGRTLRELGKMNIDPHELGRFVAEKGSLEAQNATLRTANENLQERNRFLATCNENLARKTSALTLLDAAYKTKTVTICCRSCRGLIVVELRSRQYYQDFMSAGSFLRFWCPTCGFVLVNPRHIVLQFGWSLLPVNEEELSS